MIDDLIKIKIGIIGNGEIGQAIGSFLTEYKQRYNIEDSKDRKELDGDCTLIHICIPLENKEIYQRTLCHIMTRIPHAIFLVHTSLTLDTLDFDPPPEFEGELYHCPMGGTHNRIKEEGRQVPMFLGPWNRTIHLEEVKMYFHSIGYSTVIVFNSWRETAAAKLFSVIWYGMNIGIVQQFKLICDQEKIDFTEAYTEYARYDTVRSSVHGENGYHKENRPVFFPGYIGGKCVMQDLKLLEPFFTNKLLPYWLATQNELFRKEKNA